MEAFKKSGLVGQQNYIGRNTPKRRVVIDGTRIKNPHRRRLKLSAKQKRQLRLVAKQRGLIRKFKRRAGKGVSSTIGNLFKRGYSAIKQGASSIAKKITSTSLPKRNYAKETSALANFRTYRPK
jgi:hypothetical protein